VVDLLGHKIHPYPDADGPSVNKNSEGVVPRDISCDIALAMDEEFDDWTTLGEKRRKGLRLWRRGS
jgi:hypothetical protein